MYIKLLLKIDFIVHQRKENESQFIEKIQPNIF